MKMTNSFKEVDKSNIWRLHDLLNALKIIKDNIEIVKTQPFQQHQIIPIAGQLRALIAEKSKHNKPLLTDLAEQYGIDTSFYMMPEDSEEIIKIVPSLSIHDSGTPFSLTKILDKQERTNLEEILNCNTLYVDGYKYSIENLIQWYANKSGGAHYSHKVPPAFAKIMSIPMNMGKTIFTNFLLELVEIVLSIGTKIFQK